MALFELPLTNYPDSEATFSLEGVSYVIRTRYNERAGAWFFDLSLDDGTALITGKKVVVSWLLSGFREAGSNIPPGMLYASDTSASDIDPTLEDFGTRVVMRYRESTGW